MPRALIAISLLLLTACSSTKPAADEAAQSATTSEADGGPYDVSTPMNEFMPHAFSHAAFDMWNRQGFISDKTGLHSRFPANDKQWEDAEGAALVLVEMTNTLLLPGRKVDSGKWQQSTLAVRAIAREAAQAAEKHDQDAFVDAGTRLDAACESCHLIYNTKMQPKK